MISRWLIGQFACRSRTSREAASARPKARGINERTAALFAGPFPGRMTVSRTGASNRKRVRDFMPWPYDAGGRLSTGNVKRSRESLLAAILPSAGQRRAGTQERAQDFALKQARGMACAVPEASCLNGFLRR